MVLHGLTHLPTYSLKQLLSVELLTLICNNRPRQALGGRAAATACPAPLLPRGAPKRRRADGNVAAVSHGQHVLTPTAAAA